MTVIDGHLPNKKFSLHKSLNRIAQTFVATVLLLSPVRLNAQTETELPPDVVVQDVYSGIIYLHGSQAVPQAYYNVEIGTMSPCGPINGSLYCSTDHTIYITTNDIQLAYEYGDAALAYIVAHEYAHAMQTAFGFKPNITPISELQADCLAGLYLGVIDNLYFDAADIEEIQSLADRFGDDYFWAADHHGTSAERVRAVSIGINASQAGIDGASKCMI